MEEFKLMVPTYNGEWLKEPNCTLDDYSEPEVPVVVRPADGLRIVLGTHDYDQTDKPDVQIERRRNGWMIFLYPDGGTDPCGYVFFLDDGRSFLVKESFRQPPWEIEVVDYERAVAEVDDIRSTDLSCVPTLIVNRPLPNDDEEADAHVPPPWPM